MNASDVLSFRALTLVAALAATAGCSSPLREGDDDGGVDGGATDATDAADGAPRNACGGTLALALEPKSACGACGTVECSGTDKVVCKDAGFNACGGCGAVTGAPGDACGGCGKLRCSPDKTKLACDDPGKNACGGCAALAGEPGKSCGGGTCGAGTFACDGTDAVKCSLPTANACGGCGTLAGAPGTKCGGVCGSAVWTCATGGGSVTCVDPVPTTAVPPGQACGTCKSLKTVCAKDGRSTFCPGDDANACGGCTVLPAAPGDDCGACGVYVCSAGKLVCKGTKCL